MLIESFLAYIKDNCRYVAKSGKNICDIDVKYFIKHLEEELTTKYDDEDISFQNTTEGLMWMRLREKFYHYICEEKERFSQPYPNTMGMKKKDASWLMEEIKSRLTKEQLNVKSWLRKEYVKMHYEDKFVKHTSSVERFLTGSDGHYTKKEVIDEQMYLFYFEISW